MPKSIKITLDDRDYGRFTQCKDDMNIPKDAILAKKWLLDGMKKYRLDNPHLAQEEKYLLGNKT